MPQNQMLVPLIKRSMDMLEKHLADFSDADLLVRPVPGANHAAWQLAHLANSSLGMTKAIAPQTTVPLPEKFAQAHTKEAAASDDASRFLSKSEVLALLRSIVNEQVAALEKMTDEQLAQPSPEPMRGFAPTLGALALMGPLHNTMHIGQIQVIRRKLGKPVLF